MLGYRFPTNLKEIFRDSTMTALMEKSDGDEDASSGSRPAPD